MIFESLPIETLILTNKVRKRLDVSTARVQIGILERLEIGAFSMG